MVQASSSQREASPSRKRRTAKATVTRTASSKGTFQVASDADFVMPDPGYA